MLRVLLLAQRQGLDHVSVRPERSLVLELVPTLGKEIFPLLLRALLSLRGDGHHVQVEEAHEVGRSRRSQIGNHGFHDKNLAVLGYRFVDRLKDLDALLVAPVCSLISPRIAL